MGLIAELKRRNVIRMAVLYAVSSWLILQVADVLIGLFALPDWSLRFVGFILLLGFPLALIFSWIYELTPEGLKRESEVPSDESMTPATGRRMDLLTMGLVTVAVALLVADRLLDGDDRQAGEPSAADVAPAPSPPAAAPPGRGAVADGVASIAVLPFVNMSPDADNEYFSDGLTETLLHKLAQVSQLRVAARTSSFAFKGTATDIREIAGKLDVANVLEGSVQRAGDKVRITAQLIQASDGYHLWSGTFDRGLDDIFRVQDEIAAEVADALKVSLLGQDGRSLSDGGTDNTEAYDLYLRGRDAYRQETERSLAEAERLMRRAVALDPEFALAWAGLAEAIIVHATLAGLGWDDVEDDAVAAGQRAVELAPEHPVTHEALGHVYFWLRQLKLARRHLDRSLALDPDNATALSHMADLQFSEGEFTAAVESATRAMSLDPLDFGLKADSTYKFMNIGRLAEAELLARAVLDNDPQSPAGLSAQGNIYWRTGRFAQAYRTYYRLLEINPNTYYIMGRMASMFSNVGDFEGARRWVGKMAEVNPDRVRFQVAYYCYLEGDRQCTLNQWRDLAAEEDDAEMLAELRGAIAWLEGDWQTSVDHVLDSMIEEEKRGSTFSVARSRLDAAYLYDRMGEIDQRDRYLEQVKAQYDRYYENGATSQYTWLFYADVAAIRGEVASVVENLEKAIEGGFRDIPHLTHSSYYDKVLDHPRMVQLIEDLQASNWTERQRLESAVAELEGARG